MKTEGKGDVKMVMNRNTGEARCFMRKQNTVSIVCNFFVVTVASFCELKPHHAFMWSSEKSWEWLALDSSEEPKTDQLAVKYEHSEWAEQFQHAFDGAVVLNKKQSSQKIAELVMAEAEEKDMEPTV